MERSEERMLERVAHYPNEKLEPRKSKVSVALAINHGLGGPKAMAKAAADGQTVNIPSLPFISMG